MAKDRLNEPSDLTPMNISEIMALPTFLLYPMFAQLREISILEQRGVIVTGFIARVRLMRDGDYKIQITSAPVNGCLRYNSPEQLVTELTPGVQARKTRSIHSSRTSLEWEKNENLRLICPPSFT